MSNYRAIATLTAVMRDILVKSQLGVEGNSVSVRVSPPSALKGLSDDVLNLFLYQVTPSTVHNSFNLPTRNQNGKLLAKPSLALDLHYLLTSYSSNELKAQLMLSNAIIFLQENAIISKNTISDTINNPDKFEGEDFLSNSNLDRVVRSINVSLQSLSIEELTKLWSSFFQTDYRLSVSYKVSMVLLESELEIEPSIPVSKRQLRVVSLKRPLIEKLEPQIMAYDSTRTLAINGRNLDGDRVYVKLSGNEIEVVDKKCLSENQIKIVVPKDTLAGVKYVQVLQKILFDSDDKVGHKGQKSNVMTFVLTPELKKAEPSILTPGQNLTLHFEPSIAANQKVNILIGSRVLNVTLPQTATLYPLSSLTVALPTDISAGTYPVRIRIDNADSSLKAGNSPTITINNSTTT